MLGLQSGLFLLEVIFSSDNAFAIAPYKNENSGTEVWGSIKQGAA
jgi:hypothetical protein